MSASEMFWPEDPLPMPGYPGASHKFTRGAAPKALQQQRRHRPSYRRKATYRWERLTRVAQRVSKHKCQCRNGRQCVSCYAREVIAAERAHRMEP